jgi:hypothetical protein
VSTHGRSVVWIVIVKIVKIKKQFKFAKKELVPPHAFFSFVLDFRLFVFLSLFWFSSHCASCSPAPC